MENNRVQLIGLLGKDPETKTISSGSTVSNFSIATDESYKDRDGEWQKKTEWHNITAWEKQAEYAEANLSKGDLVLVIGKLQTQSWEDDNGDKKYKTVIIANFMQKMVKREKADREERNERPARKQEEPKKTKASAHTVSDEDIPF